MASPRRLKTLREPPSASDIDHCALRAHRVRVSADFGLCCERERYAAPLLVDAPSPSLYAAVSATRSLCVFEAYTRSMTLISPGILREGALRAHRARVSADLHSCRERDGVATWFTVDSCFAVDGASSFADPPGVRAPLWPVVLGGPSARRACASPLLVEVLGARLPVCVYGRPAVRGACPVQCLARVRFPLTRRVLLPTCTRAVSAKSTPRESGDNSERGAGDERLETDRKSVV